MSYDVCPVSDEISQSFGCTDFPSEWSASWCASGHYHSGIDFGHTGGGWNLFRKPVYATRAGVIVAVGRAGDVDWGFPFYLGPQAVCLKTHEAYFLYAHLDEATVSVGQTVQVGHQIGLVGTKGNSTAPHLHFEVRTDGARQNVWGNATAVLDPRPYLNYLAGGDAAAEVLIGGLDIATADDILAKLDLVLGKLDGTPGVGHSSLLWDGVHPPYPKDIRDILSNVAATKDVAALKTSIEAIKPGTIAAIDFQPVLDAIKNLKFKGVITQEES